METISPLISSRPLHFTIGSFSFLPLVDVKGQLVAEDNITVGVNGGGEGVARWVAAEGGEMEMGEIKTKGRGNHAAVKLRNGLCGGAVA